MGELVVTDFEKVSQAFYITYAFSNTARQNNNELLDRIRLARDAKDTEAFREMTREINLNNRVK